MNNEFKIVKKIEQTTLYNYLLNNLEEGIIIINKDFVITDFCSKSIIKMFNNKNISDNNIIDYLFPDKTEESQDRKLLLDFLDILFNNTVTDQEMIMEINPIKNRIFIIKENGNYNEKIINANFYRFIQNDVVEKIMIIFKDNTELLKMNNELLLEKRKFKSELDNIETVIKLGANIFLDYIKQLSVIYKNLKKNSKKITNKNSLASLLNEANSLKDLSKAYGFIYLNEIILEYEKNLNNIINNNNSIAARIKIKKTNYLLFDELNKIIRLKHIFKNNSEISHKQNKSEKLEDFYNELYKVSTDFSKKKNKKIDLKIVNTINNIKFIDLIKFPVIQLIKNCIDYGIEEEIERIAKNKNDVGRILIKMFCDNNYYCIEVTDDGKGIDFEMARKKIESMNHKELQHSCKNDNLLLNYIFSSKYKDYDKPKELSCYEHGFSLIMNTINRMNGKISISTKKDIGTKFFLKIPEKNTTLNKKNIQELKN